MRALLDMPRPKGERLRLTVQGFRGSPRIDLRLWYVDANGDLRAGAKGVTVPHEAVTDLIEALGTAKQLTFADLSPTANDA
jgi:hypothetical protein